MESSVASRLRLVDKSSLPSAGKTKLLDQLSEAMRARHYSRHTEKSYRHWVRRFIYFHGMRHPETMAEEEVMPSWREKREAGLCHPL